MIGIISLHPLPVVAIVIYFDKYCNCVLTGSCKCDNIRVMETRGTYGYGTIAISIPTRNRLRSFCEKYGYRQTRKADEAIVEWLDRVEGVQGDQASELRAIMRKAK